MGHGFLLFSRLILSSRFFFCHLFSFNETDRPSRRNGKISGTPKVEEDRFSLLLCPLSHGKGCEKCVASMLSNGLQGGKAELGGSQTLQNPRPKHLTITLPIPLSTLPLGKREIEISLNYSTLPTRASTHHQQILVLLLSIDCLRIHPTHFVLALGRLTSSCNFFTPGPPNRLVGSYRISIYTYGKCS